ncbi:MAG: hypothetical protein H6983_13200 [Ectothiorhodospiraceae bacterium]|nr:hypothetical protein [Ectothiorhodospiraceae bacterium]
MTSQNPKESKPGIEELEPEQLDGVVGGAQSTTDVTIRRKLTLAEELRLKEQHAMGPEGTDIGSGAITSPKK